jgi:class 3 adenylate cyclase/tetratricopeptide (TPR) repeat protein
MTCRECGHDNPTTARFCGGCGARLDLACGACGAANPPANRYCHGCGAALGAAGAPSVTASFASPRSYTPKHLAEKILTSASALEGERKQVTVLFVDVSGFTSLSERLDPEEVHRLMKRAFDLMLVEVHRYEGTVNQFLGDGIMALFGAPIAHEDHARRAVHAALGIAGVLDDYRAELAPRGITFRARQGLNTGLVVVGSIGGDLRMDYTAVGDTTNVAARLQQASEPGRVTISEATHRLVRGYFETRALGDMHLKGKDEPVAVFEVLAAHPSRTRLEIEADRGLTPFVGRARELRLLLDAYERAKDGEGQVVFVVGDPGIGKSRLLRELRRHVGDGAGWQEGHCLSFGHTMTFHPLVDLLRRQFGVEESDSESAIAAKIQNGITEAGEDPKSTAPYVRALLSVDPGDTEVRAMNPAQRRGETFEVLRRLLVRAAARQPQVYVIEDLHWIDSASEQFLVSLVDSVARLRALLVFTYRPGYANPFGERSYFTRLVPAALSADDSARMAAAVLAADDLPPELRRIVGGKAEGNPFYVEELVKSLEESGAVRRVDGALALARPLTELVIPETIHDVVAARIDRLAEAPKRTLQLASVIGREFTRRLVDRLGEMRDRTGDDFLHELTALELILERHQYPELAYMFKHALTQDVAYDSLLVQRRKELHGLVGRAIEELYADRLPEQYEVLGYHFSKAEDWTRALDFLVKAAEKAMDASGLRQALELYDQALHAATRAGASLPVLIDIHRTRTDLFFGIGDFVRSREEAQRLLELTRSAGDRVAEAGALVQLAAALQWTEDFPEAHERVRQAIALAEDVGAPGPLGGALFIRSYMNAINGKLDIAEPDLVRALDIGRKENDPSRQAFVLQSMANRRGWQGDYGEGRAIAEEGIRIAREHRLVVPLLRNLWAYGMSCSDTGDYDAALAALSEGLALAEKIGDDAFIPRFLNTIGWLRIDVGDLADGIAWSERSYDDTARSSRAGHGTGAERRAFIRNNMADALMVRGELAAAGEALEESLHIVRHPPPSRWMTWRYTTHCYASLGQLALLRGDLDGARRHADESLGISTPTRSRKFESWAWRIKGESATRRHAWSEAEDALGRALALAETIRHPRQTWLTHVALGRLRAAQGRRDEAIHAYRTARTMIGDLRAHTHEPGLLLGLTSSPLILEAEHLARG